MTFAIESRYLMISPIAYHEDAHGSVWLDVLWSRDLCRHFSYVSNLTVAAPRARGNPPADWVKVEPPPGARLTFVPLPNPASAGEALLQLPRTAAAILRAVRNSDIVHSGMAGWPLPLGLIANPLAVWHRKPLVIVVESAFWRLNEAAKPKLRVRVSAFVTERLARWSVRRAALSVFTTSDYKASLANSATGALLVTPASWVSEEDLLDDPQAEASWASKPRRLSLLFAGRLTAEKGVRTLLEAMEELDRRGTEVRIDVIGAGPLRRECESVRAGLRRVSSEVLEPLPYGPEFRTLLRGYHGLVAPSITDEQPRIVYDAYSQAVPVLASDTGGHRQCVADGATGVLFRKNDPRALAEAVEGFASRSDLSELGKGGLRLARAHTHGEMHRLRAQALREVLGETAAGGAR